MRYGSKYQENPVWTRAKSTKEIKKATFLLVIDPKI
jgi:hypothetical protein